MGHINCSCEGNERKSTCSGCMVKPGQSPAPSPSSVTRSRWGGGAGGRPGLEWRFWAGKGGSLASQYRELESHLFLASKIHGWESHLNSASCCGRLFWWVILASPSSTLIWRVFMASECGKYSVGFLEQDWSKEKRSKLCIFRGPVILHHKYCI